MAFTRAMMAIRTLFDRRRVESEMEKEMRLHLELETERNIRQGMSPAEAGRAAMIAFGGVEKTKEAVRDERATSWLDQASIDFRFALRGMRKQPGFTLAVIALLALGTGANAAIFSVVNQMILRPIPFKDGGRMVQLRVLVGGGEFQLMPRQPLVEIWRGRARAVEDITVSDYLSAALGDTTREPVRRLSGAALGPGMMKFVGMRPVIGRDILPSDTVAGAPPIAILGHALWTRDFGGSRDVLGKTITLNGQPHHIVGVARKGFGVPFSDYDDVFTALTAGAPTRQIDAIAKLRPGFTAADASRDLAGVAAAGLSAQPDPDNVALVRDGSSIVSEDRKQLVLMLFGAVGFVLLIACANVANLMLSRAWSRQREFAVRAAMGAGRGRIARQVFTESLLLACCGGTAGLFVALAFLKLVTAIQPENIIGSAVGIDPVVLAWTLSISVLTGVLFGIAPALLIGDGRLSDVLKTSARATTGTTATRRLRSGLVVSEVALSVVLLVGAGLLVRTLTAMQRADTGFESRGLSGLVFQLTGKDFADSTVRRDALRTILDRARRTPGIDAATLAMTLPPEYGVMLDGIEISGRPRRTEDSLQAVEFTLGMPDLFSIAGLRFKQGRPFVSDPTVTDRASGSEAVINERLARRFWPDGNAIGARIKGGATWSTVVGIVDNVQVPGAEGIESGEQLYQPLPASPRRVTLVGRSRLPATSVEPLLRTVLKESAPRARIVGFVDADAQMTKGRATRRFTLTLLGGFAALALILAGVGLYAVVAYSVSQRTREIGIRVALGAQSAQIGRLVLSQGLTLAVIGVGVGCMAGAAATRAMRSLLYEVQPGDPLTIVLVAFALLLVAVVASAIPARRAMRVDPVDMVRAE